ncbi:MAG: DNA primase [Pedosphaera sp.]|nr:DNA primase [Pedosphaera sp.]
MAGFISPAALEQIRAANDIIDVIGAALPLKRAGANFVALCPFHKEKSPSFNVNPHKQIFHCFGCHKGGDVFTFIREYENLSFVEAVQRLADRAKIPLELDQSSGAPEGRFLKDTLLKIHEEITQRWNSALNNEASGEIARTYLAKRGVSDEAVKLFRLGSAPELWDDTVNWAKSKGHDLDAVEKAGLIIKKENGGYYDRFRGRLMFPICDEQGRVIAFSGRVLSGDEKTAKYVNSPETEIFRKSKVFFGLDKSKRAILDAGFAIICEGQLDLIACYMAGIKNIVAPQGTAFTSDHARILKRYVDEVVLCFDSDNAGQEAAVRVLDSLLSSGLAIRVATVPAPHDPDSFIKEFGGEGFSTLIAGAEDFFDYYLNRLCSTNDINSDKGRITIVREMSEALQKTGNAVLMDNHSRRAAARLGVKIESFNIEFKKQRGRRPDRADEEAETDSEGDIPTPPSSREHWLLKLMLQHEELIEWAAAHLDLAWIAHAGVHLIIERCLLLHQQGQDWTPARLITEEDDDSTRALITEVLAGGRPIPNPSTQLGDVLLFLRNQYLDQQLSQLIRRAEDTNLTDAERNEALRERQAIQQAKRRPLIPRADTD